MFSIANCLTASNLIFGCLGIVYLFQTDYQMTIIFSFLAAIADLLDGFVARLLNQQSELGKELDSLADIVSFGVLPACIAHKMMLHFNLHFGISLIAFLLAPMMSVLICTIPFSNCRLILFKTSQRNSQVKPNCNPNSNKLSL